MINAENGLCIKHDVTPVSSTIELCFSFFLGFCPPSIRVDVRGAEVGGGRGGEGGGGEGREGGGD